MAWRPTKQLIEANLDNTLPGMVIGYLRFVGITDPVTVRLRGDFHRDIRGAAIVVRGPGEAEDAQERMSGFATYHTGDAGDITLGYEPFDYGTDPYIEWFSEQNGRVVLLPEARQVAVRGTPLPFLQTRPLDRGHLDRLMLKWLTGMARNLDIPAIIATKLTEDAGRPFTHWIVPPGIGVVAEAAILETVEEGVYAVHARLLNSNVVTLAVIPAAYLIPKDSMPAN